jgi:hypothetical protein
VRSGHLTFEYLQYLNQFRTFAGVVWISCQLLHETRRMAFSYLQVLAALEEWTNLPPPLPV